MLQLQYMFENRIKGTLALRKAGDQSGLVAWEATSSLLAPLYSF